MYQDYKNQQDKQKKEQSLLKSLSVFQVLLKEFIFHKKNNAS